MNVAEMYMGLRTIGLQHVDAINDAKAALEYDLKYNEIGFENYQLREKLAAPPVKRGCLEPVSAPVVQGFTGGWVVCVGLAFLVLGAMIGHLLK